MIPLTIKLSHFLPLQLLICLFTLNASAQTRKTIFMRHLDTLSAVSFDSSKYKRPAFVSVDSIKLRLKTQSTQYKSFDSFLVDQNTLQDFLYEYLYESSTGDSLCLMDFNERYIFLDIWYRGCSPCIYAMPEMKRIDSLLEGSPIRFVSYNLHDENHEVEITKTQIPLADENWLARPRLIFQTYQIKRAPQFILIDKQSLTVIYYVRGYPVFKPEYQNRIYEAVSQILKEIDDTRQE